MFGICDVLESGKDYRVGFASDSEAIGFDRRKSLGVFGVLDVDIAVLNFDCLARQANTSLDVVLSCSFDEFENDDLPTFGGTQSVSQFTHEDTIAGEGHMVVVFFGFDVLTFSA